MEKSRAQSLVHEGGIIPKTLYKSMSEDDGSGNGSGGGGGAGHGRGAGDGDDYTTNGGGSGTDAGNTSIYQSIDLKPGQIHEVVIRNNDPRSVLTWDFDVIRSDMHFTVFRTAKTVSHLNGK